MLAGSLVLFVLGAQTRIEQRAHAQQAIPDAPRPQTSLPLGNVAPGEGATMPTTSSSDTNAPDQGATQPAPAQTPPPAVSAGPSAASSTSPPAPTGQSGTVIAPPGQGEDAIRTLYVHVDAVDIAFTVKDSKGRLVPGLQPRDIQVYENGLMQHITTFTDDALPMSVALVIDQSMSQDNMTRVNDALGALQDAFTKYDEISVFTYNKGTKQVTDFTGAQSPRLAQAIERSKSSGREPIMAGSLSGPLAQTTVINNQNFDPNTAANRGHSGPAIDLMPPKEAHPLNDAILAAATALSTRPIERRRVIYVISDGKEYGSQAKMSQVLKILQTNNIEVDGTLVGESAVPYVGVIDKIHLPLMMRDNVLIQYQKATGGQLDSEFRLASIEKSFARVASEARNRYTVGYYSPEPFIDGKYRKVEIRVLRPDLTILAPPGYWPSAMQLRRTPRPATSR